MVNEVLAYLRDNRDNIIADLKNVLKYATISSRHDNADEFNKAAEYIKKLLQNVGMTNVETISSFGNPIIFAEKILDRSFKTILFYAHYDVQPAEPLDLWETDPFSLEIKDGVMFGRGVSDDKGMLMAVIKALEFVNKNNIDIKYNVKIMFEPCEEACSRELSVMFSALEQEKYKKMFECDSLIACDSSMSLEDVPTITTAIRGCVGFELVIKGPNRDLHSGQYGGCVGNPIHELCRLIALMHDKYNHISIDGFYEGVKTTSEGVRECSKYNINEEEMKKDLGVNDLLYEMGFSPREATRIRPTIEVNGIYGGHTGEGGKTIIPSTATAKISIRLVDEQDPRTIMEYVKNFIKDNILKAFTYEIKMEDEGSGATVTDTQCETYVNLIAAIQEEYNKSVVEVKMGGSIPIMNTLQKSLNCNILFFGTGSPTSNCHGPNEHMSIDALFKAISIIIRFIKK